MKSQRNRIAAWVLCIILCIQLVPIHTGAAGSIQTMTEKANAEYMYGTWVGTYMGSEERNIVLEIDYCNSDGVFQGCATINDGAVKYVFSGNVNFQSGAISFIGKEWLVNEAGFTKFVEFSGEIDGSQGKIEGIVGGNTNQTFKLEKKLKEYTSIRKDLSEIPVDWTGWYDGKNGDTKVPRNLELHIDNVDEIGNIVGIAIVSPSENADVNLAANGSYHFYGTISPYTLKIGIQGYAWIDHPLGKNNEEFGFVALTGYINTADKTITGTTPAPNGVWEMAGIDFEDFELETEFEIGKHNGHFFHNDKRNGNTPDDYIGFLGVENYQLKDEMYLNCLLSAVPDTDRNEERSVVQAKMDSQWGGDCYGLTSTMLLVHNKDIGVLDLTDKKGISENATYYSLKAPHKDSKFLDVLHTWQLSQQISAFDPKYSAVAKTFGSIFAEIQYEGDDVDSLSVFLYKMVQECRKGKVFVLNYSYQKSMFSPVIGPLFGQPKTITHSVLVTGSRYDPETHEYIFDIYDVNLGAFDTKINDIVTKFGIFRISDDYSGFCYEHTEFQEREVEIGSGKWAKEAEYEWAGLFLINGDVLKKTSDIIFGSEAQVASTMGQKSDSKESAEGRSALWLRMGHGAFTIENDNGEYLAYDGEKFGGTMAVYNIGTTTEGEQSQIGFETDYSRSFTITNMESGIDLEVVNENAFMALSGTNLTSATLDEANGIELDGNQYSFKAFLTTDEISDGEDGLVSISANVDSGKVKIESEGTSVTATAEGTLEDVTTKTYIGIDVYEQKLRDSMSELTVDATDTTTNILDFTDVPFDAFYYDPVLWAVKEGITTGTSATTFGPSGECLRAHVVTFLWRAAGCPEPTATENPFVDVKEGDFFHKAVLWAVENGITNGVDATHFGPTVPCNRAQVVTFLYRAMQSPAVGTTACPFTDVVAGQWYEPAVLWAVENGITNGLSADTFGVETTCNRAQVVTFLYRTYVN